MVKVLLVTSFVMREVNTQMSLIIVRKCPQHTSNEETGSNTCVGYGKEDSTQKHTAKTYAESGPCNVLAGKE